MIGQNPRIRKKPMNIFILHQCVVDLLGCLAVNFRLIYDDMSYVQHLDVTKQTLYCNIWLINIIHIVLYGVSGYNLVAMSFERHQAITKPFEYDEVKVCMIAITNHVISYSKLVIKFIFVSTSLQEFLLLK